MYFLGSYYSLSHSKSELFYFSASIPGIKMKFFFLFPFFIKSWSEKTLHINWLSVFIYMYICVCMFPLSYAECWKYVGSRFAGYDEFGDVSFIFQTFCLLLVCRISLVLCTWCQTCLEFYIMWYVAVRIYINLINYNIGYAMLCRSLEM